VRVKTDQILDRSHSDESAALNIGVCCDEQRIVFNGKQLEDDDVLSLCGVEEEATLYCLGSLLGGAKKRKKKTYTKPKKQKHKHKKVRRIHVVEAQTRVTV
jgi:small subunit ribosomal protein S27Ae